MVGTLKLVGEGRMPPADMARILAARDRGQAGPTAPPDGLCLMAVRYDPDPFAGGSEMEGSPVSIPA
jgi:tRNA pseudouridine38-40 synthase